MFCDCLTSRQIILSLKIKQLLYVMQTCEDIIYQFVACKNHVLFAFNADNQRLTCVMKQVRSNILTQVATQNLNLTFVGRWALMFSRGSLSMDIIPKLLKLNSFLTHIKF